MSDTPRWDRALMELEVRRSFVQRKIDQAQGLLALNDASQTGLKIEYAELEMSKGELADLKDAMNDVELDFVDANEFRQTYTAVPDLNSSVSRNMIQLEGRIEV